MDWTSLHLPWPVALAAVATLGYLVGLWRRRGEIGPPLKSRHELRRAQFVANELERIAVMVKRSLSKHQVSLSKFRDQIGELGGRSNDIELAMKEFWQNIDDMLRPTLQLAGEMAVAYDEIRQQSVHLMSFTEIRTDPLTRVGNRRGLEEALQAQFAMKARYETNFTLAIFDIDNFKQLNDSRGHLYGDQVLQELAAILEDSARETDIVARYGGEEFVVIMPQTDLQGACVFADRMRERVAEQLEITISGGVSLVLDEDTEQSLLARADSALYAAKESGRNRIHGHDGYEIYSVEDEAINLGTSTQIRSTQNPSEEEVFEEALEDAVR